MKKMQSAILPWSRTFGDETCKFHFDRGSLEVRFSVTVVFHATADEPRVSNDRPPSIRLIAGEGQRIWVQPEQSPGAASPANRVGVDL